MIETDGVWFRIVEVPAPDLGDKHSPLTVPTVRQTKRGNGTRWIEAR